MKTLVVMPTYNEMQSLAGTVNQILADVSGVDILIVDDNSPDGTGKLADSLAAQSEKVSVLHRAQKQGLGPAYIEGFKHAFRNEYEIIVEMDADGSHRVEDLPALLLAAREADLVIGSRWIRGGSVSNWPVTRRALSKGGNVYARWVLGTKIRDMTSGFRAYRAGFLKELVSTPISSQGYSFQVELAFRADSLGVVKEVPITFVERAEGNSKMTLGIVLEALAKIQLWGIKRIFG